MKSKIIQIIFIFFAVIAVISCSSNEDKLFKAIKNGDLEQVRTLVDSGVSVLSSNKNGLTALEVARLNNQSEIAKFLYEETKIILDEETDQLIKIKFSEDIANLKNLEIERKKYYDLFSNYNDKILKLFNDTKRLSEDILKEQEKYFKFHQQLIKQVINAKVDLIDNIMNELVKKDYVSNIESGDARNIVNMNIIERLDITK